LAFVWTYLKQVVAELRKVIWPNRKQMVSYTTVVLVFLAFMVTLIGLVDLGLAKLVMFVFG
jgi:preprotein translocase subunit SecE